MFGFLFRAEVKLLFRSPITWILLAVSILIGGVAALQGHQGYTTQQITRDSLLAQNKRSLARVQAELAKADTSQEKQQIESIYFLDFRLNQFAIKQLSPLSAWCVGQQDIFPLVYSLRFNQPFFAPTQQEFNNPTQLLAGNFDLAYFLLFLFPLLFIALSYTIPATDVESGIYPLVALHARRVSVTYAQRIAARWIIAVLPFLLVTLTSWWWMGGGSIKSLLAFVGLALVYQLFWLVLLVALVPFRWRTVTQSLVLIGIWLLLLFILPALPGAHRSEGLGSEQQIATTRFRAQSESIWQQSLANHRAFLNKRYPDSVMAKLPADTNQVKYLSWGIQMIDAEKALFDQMEKMRQAQDTSEALQGWWNPVAAFYRALSAASGTDLSTQLAFESQVFSYRYQKAIRFFEHEAFIPRFTTQHLAKEPTFETPSAGQLSLSAALPALSWLGWLLLATGLIYWRRSTSIN